MAQPKKIRNAATIIGLAIFPTFCAIETAWADQWSECVRETASATLMAKIEFQRGLRDLIIRHYPQFEELATINQNLQVKLAELKRAKYDYLLKHDRDRIDTANGLSRFSNFDWFDEDAEQFKKESESYRILETQIIALRRANNGHPDWPKLREHFQSDLNTSQDFKILMERLQLRQNAVEAMLSGCGRN